MKCSDSYGLICGPGRSSSILAISRQSAICNGWPRDSYGIWHTSKWTTWPLVSCWFCTVCKWTLYRKLWEHLSIAWFKSFCFFLIFCSYFCFVPFSESHLRWYWLWWPVSCMPIIAYRKFRRPSYCLAKSSQWINCVWQRISRPYQFYTCSVRAVLCFGLSVSLDFYFLWLTSKDEHILYANIDHWCLRIFENRCIDVRGGTARIILQYRFDCNWRVRSLSSRNGNRMKFKF